MKYVLAVVLFIGAGALLFSSIRDLIKKIKARKMIKKAKEKPNDECEGAHDFVDCEKTCGPKSVYHEEDKTKNS